MTATYEAIATTTLSSNQSSLTFSTISGSYTDIIIVAQTKNSSTAANTRMTFNSDTGSNYSVTRLSGNGSSATSDRSSNSAFIIIDSQAANDTTFNQMFIVQINNYSNTTTYKTSLTRSNNADYGTNANVGLWRSTSAITSVTFTPDGGQYATGSTFTLYAVKAE